METRSQPDVAGPLFETRIRDLLAKQAKRQDDEVRQTRIQASTLQEWTEVGFNDANISRIAERAGVSTATLYRLYPERNQLHLRVLELGNQIILEAIREAPTHPHPFRNLVEFIHHILSLWRQSSVQLFFHTQGYILHRETEIGADARKIAANFNIKTQQIALTLFDTLRRDGFLEDRDPSAMLARVFGSIDVRTLEWQRGNTEPFQPVTGWYEEAVKITEQFFTLYGTAKFHTLRNQGNVQWLDGRALARTPFKVSDEKKLRAAIEDELPFLRGLQEAARSKPIPANADAFITQEFQRLLSKSPNRLDATNRRTRIVAAAAYQNYTQGYGRLNMAAVAKQAGVSTATLYRIFRDDAEIYQLADGLNASFYLAWLSRRLDSTNPIERLAFFSANFIETFIDPKIVNANTMRASSNMQPFKQESKSVGNQVNQYTLLNWHRGLEKLHTDNLINEPPSVDMMHAFRGPSVYITSRCLRNSVLETPNGSWFEEAWQMADDFFKIYGTPHFHAMRKKMKWDADLEAYRAKST